MQCVFFKEGEATSLEEQGTGVSFPTDLPVAFLLRTAFLLATLFKAFKPKLIQLLHTIEATYNTIEATDTTP